MSEKKPSEVIAAKLPELREQYTTIALNTAAQISGYQFTPEDRAEFLASEDGRKMAQQIEPAAVAGATLAYLDEEAERRATLEREVVGRLQILERSQRDVLTRVEALEVAPRLQVKDGDLLLRDARPLRSSYTITLPIPCSDRMPDPEARVLAFVPSQPEGRRWRVAQWCAPPAQYTDESWRDEESMVGDEAYRWQPKQVTHWMPMPEEPT